MGRYIEVFKTNVATAHKAREIRSRISKSYPKSSVHFDLSDCDRVLRIETLSDLNNDEIISIVHASGHWCEVMN